MKKINALAFLSLISSLAFCHTQEELLEKLYQNNAEIIKAESEYMQACLDVKDAKGGRGPSIDLQISGTYMVNPPIGEISVGTDDIASILADEGYPVVLPINRSVVVYEGMEHTLYNFELSLTQPIFTWGKITNAIKLYEQVADIKLLQKNDLIHKKEIELLSRETAFYYLTKMESLLDEQARYAGRLVEISEAYAKNGLLLNQDVLNAKIKAQEVDVAKKNLQREKEIQLIEMQKLFSGNGEMFELLASEINYVPDDKKLNKYLSLSRPALEELAVNEDNAQIKILKALIETSRLAKDIANASVYWKPDFALQASLGYAGQRFPWIQEDWNDYGKYSLNFSLGIRTTVWDGGKAFRDVKRREDDMNNALTQYNDSVMQLKMAAATAYSDLALAESRWKYQNLLVQNDELELKLHESEYKAGYGTEMDVLKAKIQKITDTITSYQLQTEMHLNCLTLDYLTGGRI
ncbi:MAG: TolC family protein [Treponema sp.]|nr:TolC family protein [Treponema sp.]